jgi:hypothetical protein
MLVSSSQAMNAATLHKEKPEWVCGSRITDNPEVIGQLDALARRWAAVPSNGPENKNKNVKVARGRLGASS